MMSPSSGFERMRQKKQSEWYEQWSMLADNEPSLFENWLHPNRLDDFRDKDVLEGGCGGGQHTAFVASQARSVTAVDLNTSAIARQRNAGVSHVEFLEADIQTVDLGRLYDIVFSIGVIHHTDDPDAAVANLARHVKTGGRLILWVYSREGNALVRCVVEPVRKAFLRRLQRRTLLGLARLLTAGLYPIVHTVYRAPLRWLPYYSYFGKFRGLSFDRNTLNVFDKLNAPQTQFISRARAESWLPPERYGDRHISHCDGVGWRVSGTRL